MTQKSIEKNQPERFFAAAHPQKIVKVNKVKVLKPPKKWSTTL
jgi:hypothetical protein